MIAVMLPRDPDRETLLGFWTTVTLLPGAALAVVLLLLGWLSPATGLFLAVAAGGALAVGIRRGRFVLRQYRRWNRGTRVFAARAREALIGIWYYTVVAAAGKTGGREAGGTAGRWASRDTLPSSAYPDPGRTGRSGPASGTLRDLAGWAVRSGHHWTLFLLPLFFFVRVLDPRGSRSEARDIYTLY